MMYIFETDSVSNTLVASRPPDNGWRDVMELAGAINSFKLGGTSATDLRNALNEANQNFTREGSWWDQGARDNYFDLKGQAESAMIRASGDGTRAVAELRSAVTQFRQDGSRTPLNNELSEARSAFRDSGTNWDPETRQDFLQAESTASALLARNRQRTNEAWNAVTDLRDATRGFNAGGLTATDVNSALRSSQAAYDANGASWPPDAQNNFLRMRQDAREALATARTEGPKVVSTLNSAIQSYYSSGNREQLNDALFSARQAFQARGGNWSEQAQFDYRNTATRAADLLAGTPAAGARRTVDPGLYAGELVNGQLTQVRLQEQQLFDGNKWQTTGFTAIGPHVSRNGQLVSERFKRYELRRPDGQAITDPVQAQARARQLFDEHGITTMTDAQRQFVENRRANPLPSDGSLGNTASIPTQLRAAKPDTALDRASRAVGDFTEGLVQGRPGAAGDVFPDPTRMTDLQRLQAQTMPAAQRQGVNLRDSLNLFAPVAPVVLDGLSAVDLLNNPYKEQIYGRTAGDAALSTAVGAVLEIVPLPGSAGVLMPSPGALAPGNPRQLVPPVGDLVPNSGALDGGLPNRPALPPAKPDSTATTPPTQGLLPPADTGAGLPPGGTPPRRPTATGGLPQEPNGNRPIQPEVLPPEPQPKPPAAIPGSNTLALLRPEQLGLPTRVGRDGVNVIDPQFSGPTASYDRAAWQASGMQLRTVTSPNSKPQVWAYGRDGQPIGFVPNARLADAGDRLWDVVRHNASQIADPGKRDAYLKRWKEAIEGVMTPNEARTGPDNIADKVQRLNEMQQADWLRQMREGPGNQIILRQDDPRLPENRRPPGVQGPGPTP
jgi:hypothetical protein